MEDCLDSLGKSNWFTTLACNSGYWQVPIAEEDRDKTAFVSHCGQFRWRTMPFGLTNTPRTFQRTADIILARQKWRTRLVYLDDIIVFSEDLQTHERHFSEIIILIQKAGLSLKLRKCKFFSMTDDYLGHVVRPGRLAVAEKNKSAVKRGICPTTRTQMRSFWECVTSTVGSHRISLRSLHQSRVTHLKMVRRISHHKVTRNSELSNY